MFEYQWWKDKVVPNLLGSFLVAAFTALFVMASQNVSAYLSKAGQSWVPDYTFIFTAKSGGCPDGWQNTGKVLLDIGENDKAIFELIAATDSSQNLYEQINVRDAGQGNVKDWNFVSMYTCMKLSK